MQLTQLIDKLNLHTYLTKPINDPNKDIYTCEYLQSHSDVQELLVNCIYITDDIDNKEDLTYTEFILLYVDSKSQASQIRHQILSLLLAEQTFINNKSKLIEASYSNHSIQDFIDKAFEVIDNPIILVDTSYKIIASSQNLVYDRPDLEEQSILGYMTEENIADMKRDKVYELTRKNRYPYYNKAKSAKYGWVTSLISIHGIETAQMGIIECNHTITDMDLELINFLCRLISLELQKSNFYITNHSLMHSLFLSELLDNRIKDIHTIKKRIQNLSWNVTEYMYMMTISEQHADFFDKKAQLISKQLHKILPNSRWVIYDGRIVFLICLPDTKSSSFNQDGALSNYLRINHLTAGISRCFHSFLDVHKYYEESLTAHTMGQRFSKNKYLFFYSDYMSQHIGSIISEQCKLSDFYHPIVLNIKAYDRTNNTQLFVTLKEYLTYPDNPTLVAEHLYIHKNTLFYRMAKIKELFNMDLSNGEERLMIHLTMKFMELE